MDIPETSSHNESDSMRPSAPATPVARHVPHPGRLSSPPLAAVDDGESSKGTHSVSMTPPPSGYPQQIRLTTSSPPITYDPLSISEDHVRQASPDELRAMLTGLLPSFQEARTDAAHYRLQYRMLAIESAEAVERIQVEMDMAQREIEVMQNNDVAEPRIIHIRSEPDPSMRLVHVDMYNSMIQEIQDLKAQNGQLESTVSQQKRMVLQQESEIASLNDRVLLLRDRLRENRDHLNRYRRTAGFLDSSPSRTSTYLSPSSNQTREQQPFAALLHATDLMSNQGTMTPRTPKRKRASSISPTPKTPRTVQPTSSRNIYETPSSSRSTRHLQIPQTAPPLRLPRFMPNLTAQAALGEIRARESEATVSAAEDSEAETEVPDENDLAESNASLLASQMLQSPSSSRQQGRVVRDKPALVQGKLFGQVRKSGVQRGDEQVIRKSRIQDLIDPRTPEPEQR